ncbi:MAG: glucuronate isomerase [Pirellulales bacterium]|nr:glucuronate isomerase [Pirellulales bacterium]
MATNLPSSTSPNSATPASLRTRIFDEIQTWTLIDPHTHIDPHRPAATSLAEILGYHYYTELVHSAGVPREEIEAPGLSPRDKVARLVAGLAPLENTIQYSWLIELCREFFDFQEETLTLANWEALYEVSLAKCAQPDWPRQVLQKSNLRAVFLTNDFDDPLRGLDTSVYVPCLRTDDLVFHLRQQSVRDRLAAATNGESATAMGLRKAIGKLFEHFTRNGCRACAISLPPDFTPLPGDASRADRALAKLRHQPDELLPEDFAGLSQFVFWTLAEYCAEYRLPFDLMIGVNRRVYPGGVYQGMDLYDSRVSLLQYRELFNAFPRVTFPISVLASVTNQELVGHAWIFPNVVTNGHWWYSNTPSFIEADCRARLEAVPRTKQIGYYSDMYKLEFALPKLRMYQRILSKILAEQFVIERGWSEERTLDLARDLLVNNIQRIFYGGEG